MPDDGSTMATRWARVTRGLIAATFAVFVAAFAHVAGGGQMPSAAGLALAFSFSALACIALAGHTVSRVRIAVSVILSQGALHLLFIMTGGDHAGATMRTTDMAMPGMGAGIHVAAEPVAAVPASASMYASGWMWLAHAAAAIVTIIALFFGEGAFWGVCESAKLALTRGLGPLRPVPVLVPPRLVGAAPTPRPRRRAHFLLTGLKHRGPPLTAAASA